MKSLTKSMKTGHYADLHRLAIFKYIKTNKKNNDNLFERTCNKS